MRVFEKSLHFNIFKGIAAYQSSVRNELTGRPSCMRSPTTQSWKAYLTATGSFTSGLTT